jgi:hypothetical protein
MKKKPRNYKPKFTDPVVRRERAIHAASNKQSELARLLNVGRSTVNEWPEFLPPLHAYRVAQIFPDIVENPQ